MGEHPIVYLYVHVIWSVDGREPLLSKPVRNVLFAHMQKDGEEKGLTIVAIGGVEDHIHCLLQLMPSQNLLQVLKSIRTASSRWLNENKFMPRDFEWEEGYAAYSVSPSGVKQVVEYIGKQEDYHQSKTLENELDVVRRFSSL